jgi:hypothetical protein
MKMKSDMPNAVAKKTMRWRRATLIGPHNVLLNARPQAEQLVSMLPSTKNRQGILDAFLPQFGHRKCMSEFVPADSMRTARGRFYRA